MAQKRRDFVKKAGLAGVLGTTVVSASSGTATADGEWWRESWETNNTWEALELPSSDFGHTIVNEHLYVERSNRETIDHPTHGRCLKNNFNIISYARASEANDPSLQGEDGSGSCLMEFGLDLKVPGNYTHINYPQAASGNVIGGSGPYSSDILSETSLTQNDLPDVDNDPTVAQALENQSVESGIANTLVSAGGIAASYFGLAATGYGLAFLGLANALGSIGSVREVGKYRWELPYGERTSTDYEKSFGQCYIWDLAVYGEITDDYIQPDSSFNVEGFNINESHFDNSVAAERKSVSLEIPVV